MTEITKRRYRPRRRWLTMILMAALSVGLTVASTAAYTALRADYLTPGAADTSPLGELTPLTVDAALAAQYGVSAVSRTADGRVVAESTVRGYRSDIRVQSVLSADGERLHSMRVLSQNETEYLGERVQTEAFAAGFGGRRLPLKLRRSVAVGSPVDGLSGATVSSQAVVDAVNNARHVVKYGITM